VAGQGLSVKVYCLCCNKSILSRCAPCWKLPACLPPDDGRTARTHSLADAGDVRANLEGGIILADVQLHARQRRGQARRQAAAAREVQRAEGAEEGVLEERAQAAAEGQQLSGAQRLALQWCWGAEGAMVVLQGIPSSKLQP